MNMSCASSISSRQSVEAIDCYPGVGRDLRVSCLWQESSRSLSSSRRVVLALARAMDTCGSRRCAGLQIPPCFESRSLRAKAHVFATAHRSVAVRLLATSQALELMSWPCFRIVATKQMGTPNFPKAVWRFWSMFLCVLQRYGHPKVRWLVSEQAFFWHHSEVMSWARLRITEVSVGPSAPFKRTGLILKTT